MKKTKTISKKATKKFKVKLKAAKEEQSTMVGNVRVEGNPTPKKIAMAKEFQSIFEAAAGEVVSLSLYKPSQQVENFIEENNLTESQIEQIKKADFLTLFNFNGNISIKTRDNKLESVPSYIFRLEKAVIDVSKKLNRELEEASLEISEAKYAIHSLETALYKEQQKNKYYEKPFLTKTKRFFYNLLMGD